MITPGPFDPSRPSLSKYICPEWFRDAKFGIWSHWGPQSVPGDDDWDKVCPPRPGDQVDHILPNPNEWYARHMYMPGHKAYRHHLAKWGHPSKHGFKDILPLWKAERFDPEAHMDKVVKAGAKYFVSMGVHHDNFDLWDSSALHPWNAVQMGPRQDIVARWKKAALARGLRFGVSEHLSASYAWFQTSHGSDAEGPLAGVPYDGARAENRSYYHPELPCFTEHIADQWYTKDEASHRKWFDRMKNLLDRVEPDFFYTDGGIPFGETGRALMAHFYNSNLRRHGSLQAVYAYKNIGSGEYFAEGGITDVEKGALDGIQDLPWQTDSTTGGWFYHADMKYREPREIIHSFLDIVSKNGNLLMNVPQKPDGSLPPACEAFLAEMATWMGHYQTGIHGSRPWRIFGEGPTRSKAGHFNEGTVFTAEDFRFTQSKDGRELYAFSMGAPNRAMVLESLKDEGRPVARVELLSGGPALPFQKTARGLVIEGPRSWPSAHANGLRIIFAG